MNTKTKGKAQPRGKTLPSDAPLAAIRPALLVDFGLVDGSGIQAKAIDANANRDATGRELQLMAKVNPSL